MPVNDIAARERPNAILAGDPAIFKMLDQVRVLIGDLNEVEGYEALHAGNQAVERAIEVASQKVRDDLTAAPSLA